MILIAFLPLADLDTMRCPHCGSEMQIIAWIEQSAVILKILRHQPEALLPVRSAYIESLVLTCSDLDTMVLTDAARTPTLEHVSGCQQPSG